LKRKRIIFLSILTLFIFILLYNHSLVYYGFVQAKGQLEIIFNTRPVSEILNESSFPDSLKRKILLINDVKSFATENLGLNGRKNYITYYDQQGRELMWVVTACRPFALEAYSWDFPIIGSFTYKGFFKPDLAEKEAEKLREQGYDISIRNAGGWSTLGILKDPILSDMLNRSDGSLADLIIHELTHGTIFIRNDIEFNENLATFIGNEGAKIYLAHKFGTNSEELYIYNQKLLDSQKFSDYVLFGAVQLDSLYHSLGTHWSYERKESMKRAWINDFIQHLDTVYFIKPEDYAHYFDNFYPNNTFFMSYLRYRGGLGQFQTELNLKFNGDLSQYISYLKQKYK